MYSRKISVLLSALPTFLDAQQLLRAGEHQPPAPTAAAIFIQQNVFVCPAGQTSCLDGSGGCCSFGVACTSSRGKPVCDEACGIGPTCSFGCCDIGYTCDDQLTLCTSDTLILNSPSNIGSVSVTSTAAPSSTIRSKSPPSTSPTSNVTPTPIPGSVGKLSSSTLSDTPSSAPSQGQSTPASTKSALTSNEALTSIIPQSSIVPATVTVSGNGQGKMGLYMSMLLISCGLVFFRMLQ